MAIAAFVLSNSGDGGSGYGVGGGGGGARGGAAAPCGASNVLMILNTLLHLVGILSTVFPQIGCHFIRLKLPR